MVAEVQQEEIAVSDAAENGFAAAVQQAVRTFVKDAHETQFVSCRNGEQVDIEVWGEQNIGELDGWGKGYRSNGIYRVDFSVAEVEGPWGVELGELVNLSASLHMWLVAPESMIHSDGMIEPLLRMARAIAAVANSGPGVAEADAGPGQWRGWRLR